MKGKNIKLLIVDDHKIIRDGIKALIGDRDNIEVVGELGSGQEAIEFVEKKAVDVILMDINMPGMTGIETTKKILAKKPKRPIILALSMHNEEAYIVDMLKNGAKGYVLKESGREELIKAIQTVNQGKKYLSTEMSLQLIDDLINGKTNSTKSEVENSNLVNLTKRELEIIQQISNGSSSQEISQQLKISKRTVEAHKRNVFQKLEIKNSAALVKYAFENNLV